MFYTYSTVSIVGFEQINVGWVWETVVSGNILSYGLGKFVGLICVSSLITKVVKW